MDAIADGTDGDRELVILPALNEAARVGAVIAALRSVVPRADILVVDDGSSDETATVAGAGGAIVVRHPFRLGYGAALRTGYTFALRRGYARCLQIDADGQHDPATADALLEGVRRGEADVVVASRFMVDRRPRGMSLTRRFGSAALKGLARLLANVRATDPTSGYRAIDRRVLRLLASDDFPDDYPDLDVLIALHYRGVRVKEVATTARPRESGASMHGGWRPLYYAYKVALASVIAAWRGRRAAKP